MASEALGSMKDRSVKRSTVRPSRMALDAERTERPSIEVEGQKRAICTGRDCDEEGHLINYPS
jgi:hypothetical protein